MDGWNECPSQSHLASSAQVNGGAAQATRGYPDRLAFARGMALEVLASLLTSSTCLAKLD